MALYQNGGHHTKALPLNNLSEDQQYYEFYIKCPFDDYGYYLQSYYPELGISPYNTLNYFMYNIQRNGIL
jgi:hypothetical protein